MPFSPRGKNLFIAKQTMWDIHNCTRVFWAVIIQTKTNWGLSYLKKM